MKVAVLQLNSQGMSSTKLYKYIRIAHNKNVKVLLLGEYVLNPFFKELAKLSFSMIKEQAQHQIKILREFAYTYKITIIAPIIVIKKKKIYKTIAKFAPTSTSYYQQQILINYPHWDEESFFANEKKPIQSPLIFQVDNFKFAVMNGFELHFDNFFEKLSTKKIDCLLLPSVSTFESYERWKTLILSRAFINNYYILRANRIGTYKDKDYNWKFYGGSILASPNGDLVSTLGNKEELMIVDMHHIDVLKAKKLWGFKDMLVKRY